MENKKIEKNFQNLQILAKIILLNRYFILTEYVKSKLIFSGVVTCSRCLTKTLSFLPASFAFSKA